MPKVIVAPDTEPLTVEEARAHLEAQAYEDSDVDPIDDTMIEAWISAAREFCEDFTGLSLSTRTLEIALDRFPTVTVDGTTDIELPMGPVRDVLSVSWGDESDEELAALDFVLDTYQQPARITPVSTSGWPTVTEATNAIKIRYLTGYGVDTDGGEELPKVIRAAMLLMLGHLYENRSDTEEKTYASIPNGVTSLLRPRRVRMGMA